MTKKLTLAITALAVAFGLTATTQTFAQKIEEKNISVQGTIKAIDTKAKTITVAIEVGAGKGKEKEINVVTKTKIQKDDKLNQKLRDLAVGDKINLMYQQYQDKKTKKAAFDAVQIIVLESAPADK